MALLSQVPCDSVSHCDSGLSSMGLGGSVGKGARLTIEWLRVRITLRPLENWQFPLPQLSVSFGGDTKIRRSLLSGVYATGSKDPTLLLTP